MLGNKINYLSMDSCIRWSKRRSSKRSFPT